MTKLLCLGLGYSAQAVCRVLQAEGWHITGTSRSADGVAGIVRESWQGLIYDGRAPSPELRAVLQSTSHLLVSAGPDAGGDPLLRHHAQDIAAAADLRTVVYLSTVGVYGDHQGSWVDEMTPCHPRSERAIARIGAETAWRDVTLASGKQLAVLRLAGIYGPGRNALENLLAGEARRLVKPGQVFNRIHVDDIAAACIAALRSGARLAELPGGVVNVTDDEPAPPQDVVAYAATLLGLPLPPEIAFEQAELSPMARSFYGDNKRVSNRCLRQTLGVALKHPTYREGLASLLAGMRSGTQ